MTPAACPENTWTNPATIDADMLRLSNRSDTGILARGPRTSQTEANVSLWFLCNNGCTDPQWWDGGTMQVSIGETDHSLYIGPYDHPTSLTGPRIKVELSGAGYDTAVTVYDDADNIILQTDPATGYSMGDVYGQWQKLVVNIDNGMAQVDILDSDASTVMLSTGQFAVGITEVGGVGINSYPYEGRPNDFYFDEIAMEGDIPEPATMVLLSLGGLLLRRRK